MTGKQAVIEALFKMMPDEGKPWPKEKRQKWQDTLAQSIELAYDESTTEPTVPERPSERSQNGAQGSESQP